MGPLAVALVLPKATVTRFMTELIDLGLVYRKPGDDRRVAVVHLSRNGVDGLARVSSLLCSWLPGSLPSTPPLADTLVGLHTDEATGPLI